MRRRVAMVLTAALLAVAACSVPPMKEYAYPRWGFAVSLRAAPRVTERAASTTPTLAAAIKVQLSQAGRVYTATASDISTYTGGDETMLGMVPRAMAGADGAVSTVTYVATGKVVGREAIVERKGQDRQRVRVFVQGKRLYSISAQSVLGPDDPEVTEFLDSFRLLGG
ncbi:MAG: hypothetical protein ACHP84_01555 [Caulobacterales bacterium]